MIPIRNGVHIPLYWTQLDEKGNLKTETLKENADNMLEQLIWWAKALKLAREQEPSPELR